MCSHVSPDQHDTYMVMLFISQQIFIVIWLQELLHLLIKFGDKNYSKFEPRRNLILHES